MNKHQNKFRGLFIALILALEMAIVNRGLAIDSNQLVTVTIANGSPVVPRSIFTQSWTMTNCGTTTWTAGGYTLNLIGEDSLGAMPLITPQ